MTDGQTDENLLIGDREDIRTLVEWQQQRYHQLQNISLALLSGFLTVLAIIATVLSPHYPSLLISLPSSEVVRQVAEESILGYAAISAVIAFNYLIAIFSFALAIVFAFFGTYKLYNIVSNPPLEPKLDERTIFEKGSISVGVFNSCGFSTVKRDLRESFHKNKNLIENSRRDFKMALIRLPISLMGGHLAAQLYYHTLSLNISNILLYDIILVFPTSVLTLGMKNFLSISGDADSKPNSIAQEITRDNGRFPTELIKPERWIAEFNNMLGILIVITIIVDLAWKYAI